MTSKVKPKIIEVSESVIRSITQERMNTPDRMKMSQMPSASEMRGTMSASHPPDATICLFSWSSCFDPKPRLTISRLSQSERSPRSDMLHPRSNKYSQGDSDEYLTPARNVGQPDSVFLPSFDLDGDQWGSMPKGDGVFA